MERHLHGYIDWISKAGKVFFLSLETSKLLVSLTGCLSEDFFLSILYTEDLMLEEEEEEDGNVDVSRRRNLDRVEDGDVAMTSVVLTGQSGRRHRLNTGKK